MKERILLKAAYSQGNKNESVIDLLLEKANLQGHVTLEDLEEIIPRSGAGVEEIEEVVGILNRQGIQVIIPNEAKLSSVGRFTKEAEEDNVQEADEIVFAGVDKAAVSDTITLYLREMSKVPLLDKEQEISLAKRYEAGRAAKEELIKSGSNISPEKLQMLEKIIEDGLLAREHLIKANTRLVVSVAKRYNRRGVPFLDLIQEGNLGLMKAVEKFDHSLGFRFSTYATWWIRQTITRAIADQGRTIRVPVHMVDRIRVMYKYIREMEQKMGREPTTEELAGVLNLPKEKVEWMIQVSWLPLSLESPLNEENEESELGNFIEDRDTPSPSQKVYLKLLSEKINDILGSLPYREARILRLRFGLENGRFYTLEEVGRKFGLTRERIRQIETKALRHLRYPQHTRQLKEYL